MDILTRQLRPLVASIAGIDLDQSSIDLAHTHDDGAGIDYLLGDFLTYPLMSEIGENATSSVKAGMMNRFSTSQVAA